MLQDHPGLGAQPGGVTLSRSPASSNPHFHRGQWESQVLCSFPSGQLWDQMRSRR